MADRTDAHATRREITLDDVLITEQLTYRTSRAADHGTENETLRGLARRLAEDPADLLEHLATAALELGRAGSAGVSLRETDADGAVRYRWEAVAGAWRGIAGDTTPAAFSPSGVCVSRGAAQLFERPERYFAYLDDPDLDAEIVEALVVPLPASSPSVGTLWLLAHDPARGFDGEDLRVMTTLAEVTAMALRLAGPLPSGRSSETLLGARSIVLELLARETSLEEVLGAMVQIVEEQCPGAIGSIMLLEHEGERLRHATAPGLPQAFRRALDEGAPDGGTFAVATSLGEPVFSADIATDRHWQSRKHLALAAGIEAAWAMPLIGDAGRVLGAIGAYYHERRLPTPHERRLIEVMAGVATLAVERHAAERARRESEERLSVALGSAAHGIWTFDAAAESFEADERGWALHGFAPSDVTRSLADARRHLHPDDLPRHAARFTASRRGDGAFADEYRVTMPKDRGGEVRWVASAARWNAARSRAVGVVSDITERKSTEQAISALNARLEADLADMQRLHDISIRLIGVDDIDVLLDEILAAAIAVTRTDRGTIQLLDEASGELVMAVHRGFDDRFVAFFERVDAASASACGAAMQSNTRVVVADVGASDAFSAEAAAEMLRADARGVQSTPLTSRSGRLLGILSTHFSERRIPQERELRTIDLLARQAADLIERTRSERSLRDSEQSFRTLVEQVRDYAIFRTDTRGRATTWNEGVRRVLGFEEAEFVGLDITPAIFPRRDVEMGVPQAELDEAAARGFAGNDRWMQRKNGSRFFASGITTALRDDDGRLIGFTKVMRDQTEPERLANELKQRARQLSEADRRKDEFLATLAHELRNPLAPIRTGLEIMKRAGHDAPLMDEVRDTMERQVQQMVSLVDDLLDVARITQGKFQLRKCEMSLADSVREAVAATRTFIDECGHRLDVVLPDVPVWLEADPNRMTQVISNLLDNAAKYTPPNGHIWLTATAQDDEAVVTVADTGIGLPADRLDQIFEMFTQIERHQARGESGLGIGLTLVKSLVELHGGSIEARSEGASHGSEFVVRLPLLRKSGTGANPGDAPAREPTKHRRILIVDDNQAAARLLAMVVEQLGHTVRTAFDGVQAIEAAAAFRPEVVLMDIGMPRMNGYEAARRIRAQPGGNDMVLVALTGWGQDDAKRRIEEAGFDHHLIKPAEPADLERLLAELD